MIVYAKLLPMTDKSYDIKRPASKQERKNWDLVPLSRNISPLTRSLFGKKGFVEIDILTNWDKIVGQELADYTFPQKIDFKREQKNNGILHLQVPTGAFALEIQHREKYIIERINAYFGYNAVCNIKILQNNSLPLKSGNQDLEESLDKNLVTAEEENYINSLAADINNSKLKEILIKLGQSIFNDNKKEKK